MKNRLITTGFLIVSFALILSYAVPLILKENALSEGSAVKVLVAYNAKDLKNMPSVRAAYESVLQEEGVPFEFIEVFQLIGIDPGNLVKKVPAIVFPDNILRNAPLHTAAWAKEYLAKGGNLAVIYDAGTRHQREYYLDRAVFSDITGVNYITFATERTLAFGHANILFNSTAARDFFQVPSGKTLDGLVLSGYAYGALEYPVAQNKLVREIPPKDIYAYAVTKHDGKFPAIILTSYAEGKVLYVNLPLGALKADSDDLPLRSMLRTFLFDVVGVPHVMNTQAGRGVIIVDWHVDSSIEHTTLPLMQKMDLLRKDIAVSFDITAGEFLDAPGDGEGFDACGKGRHLVEVLKQYGTIGSHGGWAHNWFAKNIEEGTFGEKEIREYIVKNNTCLEEITGYKITEYAAPNGVHPQPETTRILEELGETAYYYTGDTGSAPNRTFYQGKMISDKVIAFPVMPFGRYASLYEMAALNNQKEHEIKEWLLGLLSYTARNRTARLFYSHPYNIEHYPKAVTAFMNTIATMQRKGMLRARPMADVAGFQLRMLKTEALFTMEPKRLRVALKNPEGLRDISIALPKNKYKEPAADGIIVHSDERYYYLTVRDNEQERNLLVDTRD